MCCSLCPLAPTRLVYALSAGSDANSTPHYQPCKLPNSLYESHKLECFPAVLSCRGPQPGCVPPAVPVARREIARPGSGGGSGAIYAPRRPRCSPLVSRSRWVFVRTHSGTRRRTSRFAAEAAFLGGRLGSRLGDPCLGSLCPSFPFTCLVATPPAGPAASIACGSCWGATRGVLLPMPSCPDPPGVRSFGGL